MFSAKLKKISKINTLIVFSLLGLSACGGDEGEGGPVFVAPVILDGVFKDSNVSGVSFVSGGEQGVTDKDGQFTYEKGKDVTFSIGAIDLGSAVGKPVMTPLDLVENGTLNSTEVINKARFIMMLDKDNKPSNGIEISTLVQEKAKKWNGIEFKAFNFSTQNLADIIVEASVADGVVHELPEVAIAVQHLKTTLLCANSGTFTGSYTGTEKGSFAFVVDPATGEVNGSSYNSSNQVSVEVKNKSALDYDNGLVFITAEDSGKVFSGEFSSTEKLEGVWVDSNDSLKKGDFLGDRIGGDSTSTYRYAASFTGDDKGLFAFNVDENSNITGVSYSVSTQKQSKLTGSITDDKLVVTSADGDSLTGFIDDKTLVITTGVWINGKKKTGGSFKGSGCRLN